METFFPHTSNNTSSPEFFDFPQWEEQEKNIQEPFTFEYDPNHFGQMEAA